MVSRPFVSVPRSLVRISAVDWDIDWRERSAGAGNSDSTQVVIGPAPRWFGSVPLVLPRQATLEWRALRLTARGRTGIYRMPMVDPLGICITRTTSEGLGLPFSTGERFSTGKGFRYKPTLTNVGAAAAGANEIVVSENQATHALRLGMLLSHDDWPFAVTSITSDTLGGDPVFVLTFEPFLRAAIPDGDLIEMDATGLFECVDGSGNPAYDMNRVAQPIVNFREWINR